MIGKKFERLTVVSKVGNKKWYCVCDCGKTKDVYESQLISGNNKSCGCLSKDVLLQRNTSHGLSKNPAYSNWKDINKRCFNPNNKRYENYKGRGISVHEDFKNSFVLFLNEIGEKPEGKGWSVGRIDNNGWYTYGNIRWETVDQQARNHTKQKNNTSGITGVRFATTTVSGGTYTAWIATWSEGSKENKSKSKQFSCNKYGHDIAKQMAIDYRNKMIEELNKRGFEYAESHGSS